MKLNYLITAAVLFGAMISSAFAQTATPVQPGSLTVTSCPGGITPCFKPYSATNASPVGGQYNSSAPTVTDGAISVLQTDVNGNLKVVNSGSPVGTQDTNLKQVNGQTVNVGTGAAGTGTQRVTTSTDSTIATITNPVSVVQSPVATQGSTPVQLGSTATNLVLKNSSGNLINASIVIGATSGYLILYNATSLPADGAVTPVYCTQVISNGTTGGISVSWPLPGKFFSTGITAGFSTTGCFTQTAATASFLSGDVK